MPGKVLLIPVFLIFLILIAYGLWVGEISLFLVIPFLVLAVGLYILQYKVNEYWYYKYPPDLSPYEKKWCSEFLPYYQGFNQDEFIQFNHELARELRLKEFILMGVEQIPEDLKLFCLAPAVKLGLSKNSTLIKHYNRIVIYPHPFITPDIESVHICETHEEDGVLIFSMDQLKGALFYPEKYLNPAAYLWATLYVQNNSITSELSEDEKWELVCKKTDKEKNFILDYFGMPNINVDGLLLSLQQC